MRMLKYLTLLLLIGFPRVALAQNDSGRSAVQSGTN